MKNCYSIPGIVLVMFLAIWVAHDAHPAEGDVPGDVNGDGIVDIHDAELVLQSEVELIDLTPEQQALGEVSGEGILGAYDAGLISQYAAGMFSGIPLGSQAAVSSPGNPIVLSVESAVVAAF